MTELEEVKERLRQMTQWLWAAAMCQPDQTLVVNERSLMAFHGSKAGFDIVKEGYQTRIVARLQEVVVEDKKPEYTEVPKPVTARSLSEKYITTKIYLHSNKDAMFEVGKRLGLEGDALSMFSRACNEVEVVLNVNRETGAADIRMVNGHALR